MRDDNLKTLKREEIYTNRYNNPEQLRTNIEEFIEEYYNRQRLHSALGYQPPGEFERQSEQGHRAESLGATVQSELLSDKITRPSAACISVSVSV